MTNFLENLKNAADKGEFNSEAAKKILEINDLADTKIGAGTQEDLEKLQESIEKRLGNKTGDEEQVKIVSEEEAVELNSEYDKKMAQFKKLDAVNAQIAILVEIEDMVKLSIEDMFSFTDELDIKFKKEFETEDPMFDDLNLKIEEIKSKYKSIIN